MNIFIEVVIWIAYFVSLYFSVFLFLVYLEKRDLFSREDKKSKAESLEKYPFISVIVPAYNEEKTILLTLESIHNLDYPKDKIEVIAVNDGSKDNTEKVITEYIKGKPSFKLMSHTNRGKAASMNRALKEIKGEFFACLDADSFVDSGTLKKMLSLYYEENDPTIAIVTPAMKVHKPKNVLQKVQWLEYLVMIFFSRITAQIDSLYVAPGPFSLYRTEIIRKIGGFQEGHITEDQEIAYRIQQKQYRIKHCPDGYVFTTAPAKIKPFYRQRRRWYLGGLICLGQYKKIIANKKYGDFGIMQMVKNVTGFILAIVGIAIVYYLVLDPLLEKLKNLFLIRFNIWPYILNLKLKITALDFLMLDFQKVFIILFLFGIGFILFYLAHKNAKEKMTKFGIIPLIPYFAFYYLLKGSILLLCLFQFSRGKKLKW